MSVTAINTKGAGMVRKYTLQKVLVLILKLQPKKMWRCLGN
jgi:hypothetical protein